MSQGGQGQTPMGSQYGYGRSQFGYGGAMNKPMPMANGMPSQQGMYSDQMMRANYMGGMNKPAMMQGPDQGRFASYQPGGEGPQGGDFLGNHAWKGGMEKPMAMPQTGGSFNPMVGSGMERPMMNPQMSTGYQVNEQTPQWGALQTSQAPQQSQPYQAGGGLLQQAPQQTLEQFTQTLGNSGMTSGQINDAYQKSLQPQSTNFFGNVGPGGTQNPYPQNPNWTPPQWGTQQYGFDPKAMAGKTVGKDMGWYYGQDAIGRTINNQGDAVAGFSRPADGFQRTNPWQRG